MRLLLSSNGISNPSIADALSRLLDKPFGTANLAFVPTAANAETGDKGWLIDDLNNLRALQFNQFDIVDISALPRDSWLPRLEAADVVAFSGGDTPHLLNCLRASGLGDLRSLWGQRVYMGISAGSIVAGQQPVPELSPDLYNEDTGTCLGLADLIFLPHLNSPLFPRVREANIRSKTAGLGNVYALDDNSALSIIDGEVEVISEGSYLIV